MKKIKYFLITKSVGLYINLLSFVQPDKANTLAYKLFSVPLFVISFVPILPLVT